MQMDDDIELATMPSQPDETYSDDGSDDDDNTTMVHTHDNAGDKT